MKLCIQKEGLDYNSLDRVWTKRLPLDPLLTLISSST